MVSCDPPLPVMTRTMVVLSSIRAETGMLMGKSSASTGKKEMHGYYNQLLANMLFKLHTFLADIIEGIGYTGDSLTT